MCTYSMILDQYRPQFEPFIIPNTTVPSISIPNTDDLRELIAEFKKASAAAHLVDKTLGTPDCEDPEKAKLIERVAELEALLDKTYVLKLDNWYYYGNNTYVLDQKRALKFATRKDAESKQDRLPYPEPRVVRILTK